jgi:hypothetical protein
MLALPQERSRVSGVHPDALARLDADVARGYVAVAPERAPSIDGTPRYAWWRIHPSSGETTAVTDEGLHAAGVEQPAHTAVVETDIITGATTESRSTCSTAGAQQGPDPAESHGRRVHLQLLRAGRRVIFAHWQCLGTLLPPSIRGRPAPLHHVRSTRGVLASAYREHRQIFPQPGWVEHDPLEIWNRTQEVVAEAVRAAPAGRILGVGITNQRETTIAWDGRSGRPAYNAIVWQDTHRPDCRALVEAGWQDDVRAKVANAPISRRRSLAAGARSRSARSGRCGHLRLGTSTVAHLELDGGPAVSPTARERLAICCATSRPPGMCRSTASACRPGQTAVSPGPYGFTPTDLGARLPVCGDLGDQQAALVGQACFSPGEAKNTYGTGSFLLQHVGGTPVRSTHGLLGTAAYAFGAGESGAATDGRAYALEGSVAITGAAVQWLRDAWG